jgi:hypothetical protein
VLTHGFISARFTWDDKDFALNAYEAHHLHFKKMDARGRRSHSNDLLYVKVLRDTACVLMLGEHRSFHNGTLEEAVLQMRADNDELVIKEFTTLKRLGRPSKDMTWGIMAS